jgi:hypothetical protein
MLVDHSDAFGEVAAFDDFGNGLFPSNRAGFAMPQ